MPDEASCKAPEPADNANAPPPAAPLPSGSRGRYRALAPFVAVSDWLRRSPSQQTANRVDIINKSMQIAAILVAGIWTLLIFIRTSAPNLEPKPAVTSEIAWTSFPTTDACNAQFSVTIKNLGQRSFNIEDAVVTVWLQDVMEQVPASKEEESAGHTKGKYTLYPDSSAQIRLITPDIVRKSPDRNNVENASFHGRAESISTQLPGHYSPGASITTSSNFIVRKSPTKFVIMDVDVTGTDSAVWIPFLHNRIEGQSWAISRVCGPFAETGEMQPSQTKVYPVPLNAKPTH